MSNPKYYIHINQNNTGHPLCTVHNFIFTDKKIVEDIWSQENRQNMTNSFKTHDMSAKGHEPIVI